MSTDVIKSLAEKSARSYLLPPKKKSKPKVRRSRRSRTVKGKRDRDKALKEAGSSGNAQPPYRYGQKIRKP